MGVGRCGEEIAPGADALDDFEEIAYLEGFERGTVDARLLEERCGIEETVEVEASAAGEKGAELFGADVLRLDPGEIGGRCEGKKPGATERGKGVLCDVLAERWPLQRGLAGLGKRRGDFGEEVRRGHCSIVCVCEFLPI